MERTFQRSPERHCDNIALVSQDVFLFEVDPRQYRDGRPDATDQESSPRRASPGSPALPLALRTASTPWSGQAAPTCPAGQKQRVAIAPPLVKNAPVIVYDEATSALDGENERAVMEAAFDKRISTHGDLHCAQAFQPSRRPIAFSCLTLASWQTPELMTSLPSAAQSTARSSTWRRLRQWPRRQKTAAERVADFARAFRPGVEIESIAGISASRSGPQVNVAESR